jgi:mannan endo-1,4-beta-mannosidase
MGAKIAAALVMPVLAVVLVAGVLKVTNHTTVPSLALPEVPSATVASATGSSAPPDPGPCLGRIPRHFAGIAVKNHIAERSISFQRVTAQLPQIVEFYNPFRHPFARGEAEQAIRAGQIPLIQLNPKGVTERQIADGGYDRHLRDYAQDVRKFGCAIILSFGHEMNGWWYPWGWPRTTPADFIAAWRHIHDVFASQGAGNVIWSWDPSHQYAQAAPDKVASPASHWYPGDKYVDMIGVDGYLGHDKNGHPQNFREIFDFQLRDIRTIAPHKRIYIAETGVAPGPDAARQIANLFAGLAGYRLSGLVWFDAVGQPDASGKPKEYRLQRELKESAAYQKHLRGFLR